MDNLYNISEQKSIYAVSVVDDEIFELKMIFIDDKEKAISFANGLLTKLKEENNFINRNYEKEVAISTIFDCVEIDLTEICCRHTVSQGFLFA